MTLKVGIVQNNNHIYNVELVTFKLISFLPQYLYFGPPDDV